MVFLKSAHGGFRARTQFPVYRSRIVAEIGQPLLNPGRPVIRGILNRIQMGNVQLP